MATKVVVKEMNRRLKAREWRVCEVNEWPGGNKTRLHNQVHQVRQSSVLGNIEHVTRSTDVGVS